MTLALAEAVKSINNVMAKGPDKDKFPFSSSDVCLIRQVKLSSAERSVAPLDCNKICQYQLVI
jgi:hypothetical protein